VRTGYEQVVPGRHDAPRDTRSFVAAHARVPQRAFLTHLQRLGKVLCARLGGRQLVARRLWRFSVEQQRIDDGGVLLRKSGTSALRIQDGVLPGANFPAVLKPEFGFVWLGPFLDEWVLTADGYARVDDDLPAVYGARPGSTGAEAATSVRAPACTRAPAPPCGQARCSRRARRRTRRSCGGRSSGTRATSAGARGTGRRASSRRARSRSWRAWARWSTGTSRRWTWTRR